MKDPKQFDVFREIVDSVLKPTAKEVAAGKVGAIESTVRQYASVKEKIEELEEERKRLKETLEGHLTYLGVKESTIAGFKVNMIYSSRENFNLKEAASKLGRQVLSPFISETAYTQLRIKRLADK